MRPGLNTGAGARSCLWRLCFGLLFPLFRIFHFRPLFFLFSLFLSYISFRFDEIAQDALKAGKVVFADAFFQDEALLESTTFWISLCDVFKSEAQSQGFLKILVRINRGSKSLVGRQE